MIAGLVAGEFADWGPIQHITQYQGDQSRIATLTHNNETIGHLLQVQTATGSVAVRSFLTDQEAKNSQRIAEVKKHEPAQPDWVFEHTGVIAGGMVSGVLAVTLATVAAKQVGRRIRGHRPQIAAV